MNTKDLQALTLVGPTREYLIFNPLGELSPNNQPDKCAPFRLVFRPTKTIFLPNFLIDCNVLLHWTHEATALAL